ncbi:MAG: hypothetical protein HYT13_03000 [Candidatus Liptonbacteria bacterium]|nr:hypothetical protein [Candidatus Liptonbacteria bacterium]
MNQSSYKNFFVSAGAGIFVGAVFFDVIPELREVIGFTYGLAGILAGVALWHLLKRLTGLVSKSSFAIVSSLGFLLHSFLEGAVTATSFGINFGIGLLVTIGMVFHLLPEFFAITAILRGEGVSAKRSVLVDLGGVATLIGSFFLVFFFLTSLSHSTLSWLIALGGGAFLYIGLTSFVKRAKEKQSVLGFILGSILIFFWNIF